MAKDFTEYFKRKEVVQRFTDILGDDAQGYIVRVLNNIEANPKIKAADYRSLENAYLVAAATGLSFEDYAKDCYIGISKKSNKWVATFEATYRGLYQLCAQTDKYETINCIGFVEGELISYDRMTEKINFDFSMTNDERNEKPIVGYAAIFKLNSGLQKTLVMSIKELQAHGQKYSDDYANKWGNGEGPQFHVMAQKTPFKLLLDKYGVKSSALTKVIRLDQALIDDNGEPDYVDNQNGRTKPENPEETLKELKSLFLELEQKIPSKYFQRWQMIIDDKEEASYETLKTELENLKNQ